MNLLILIKSHKSSCIFGKLIHHGGGTEARSNERSRANWKRWSLPLSNRTMAGAEHPIYRTLASETNNDAWDVILALSVQCFSGQALCCSLRIFSYPDQVNSLLVFDDLKPKIRPHIILKFIYCSSFEKISTSNQTQDISELCLAVRGSSYVFSISQKYWGCRCGIITFTSTQTNIRTRKTPKSYNCFIFYGTKINGQWFASEWTKLIN